MESTGLSKPRGIHVHPDYIEFLHRKEKHRPGAPYASTNLAIPKLRAHSLFPPKRCGEECVTSLLGRFHWS